jgi:penicillin amidase
MKRLNLQFFFPLSALVLLIAALSVPLFGIAPMGKFLNPFTGAVQNGGDEELNMSRAISSHKELKGTVQVFFDERKVPHIYADNTADLYYAQGYVTASMRLWEMDFLTYMSEGRLSEILNGGFLEYDRNQRRLGIPSAARATVELIKQDPESYEALTAYTKGVNARIAELSYKQLPVEYKILNYKPEQWSLFKTVLVMKYVAATLSAYNEDFSMTNMMLALGEESFNKLFPDFHSQTSPVTSSGNNAADTAGPMAYLKKPGYLDYSFLSAGAVVTPDTYNPRLGSNSWVVSGKKTKSGYPILCNDPHLNLTLPSIWLEMQLSCPGMNVYGVSIPGTPAVIIGFNQQVAWGLTNGEDDVWDWYKLKISNDYTSYEMDGKWIKFDTHTERIKVRNGKTFIDTILYTVHGPVVNDRNFAHKPEHVNQALRWEANKPSNEFKTFIGLNKAKNYADYKEAIKYYACPAQNFTFACRDNTIAVTHQGRLAVKWPGQGKFLLDGTKKSHMYDRYIPEDSLPQLVNPAANYLVSANQHPTGAGYPYYYNGHFMENRANRIKQLLENENEFDAGKMKAMQLDNVDYLSAAALPLLLAMMEQQNVPATEKSALQQLHAWKGDYALSDKEAGLFELWWERIRDYTWDELKAYSFFAGYPDDYVLLELIRLHPDDKFFDRQGTAAVETAADIIHTSFTAALTEFEMNRKEGKNQWGDFHKVSIIHLMNVGAFSRLDIPSSGNAQTINAMNADWGPSWRMIVELGERPSAYGIVAGGQSGSIGSAYYDNGVKDWVNGKYYPLHFYLSAAEASPKATAAWTFN